MAHKKRIEATKLFQRLFILSLLLFYILSNPTMAAADSDIDLVGVDVYQEYIKFHGTIMNINKGQNTFSIMVETDKEGFFNEEYNYAKREFFFFEDTMLISEKTMDFALKDDFKKGMKVSIYCDKDINSAASYSDKLWSNVVIMEDSKGTIKTRLLKPLNEENVVIDTKGLLPINIKKIILLNDLKGKKTVLRENTADITLSDETIIVDGKGSELDAKDVKNAQYKFAIYFYDPNNAEQWSAETLQLNPKKVVVSLEDKEIKDKYKLVDQLKSMNKLIINGKEVKLSNPMYRTKNEVVMVPLRQVAEAMGYRVSWIGKTVTGRTVIEVSNPKHYLSLNIGIDVCYCDFVWHVKLANAPELKNSNTYISLDVLELMDAKITLTKDGVLKID